ncbi:MAG: ROK family protein [Succinivibrionaceae bacterium]|nr:ROK family protein [Succinivibrionaceae bacterium]
MQILGVDIGGTGIKGAIIETETGEMLTERKRIETPKPATPEAVAATLKELVQQFEYNGPIGCGFPATIHHGVAFTAANIDSTWVNTAVDQLFTETTGCPCYVINDADAAGICEMKFGVGKDRNGVVMLLTIGTGIGSAVFINGQLHPNTELGHLVLDTKHGPQKAEHYCSERVRVEKDLGWNKFGRRFGRFLNRLEFLFNPDLFIIGGGVSKKFDRFSENFELRTEIKVAETLNQAGIIGAALNAANQIASQQQ